MDYAAAHVNFTIMAYVISATTILILCGTVFWRDRQLAKRLKQLNDQKQI